VNFGFNIATQVKRDFILILWNSYRFFTQHANMNNWQPDPSYRPTPDSLTILDKWLLSRFHHTLQKVTNSLDKFQTAPATKSLESFVSDLSTWYIRRSRDRSDHLQFLGYIFSQLSVCLSPFIPFFSEIIFQNYSGSVQPLFSVHTQNWPTINKEFINTPLEKQMETVREICRLAHAQRQVAQIKVRQPLSSLSINCQEDLCQDLLDLIASETNVKNVSTKIETNQKLLGIVLDTEISPQLLEEGEYRELLRAIQVLRREMSLSPSDKITITAPAWPKNFETQLLLRTGATNIKVGNNLSINKI